MPQSKQALDNQADKKKAKARQEDVSPQTTGEIAEALPLTSLIASGTAGVIENQASRLADSQVPLAQRQAMATQIGHLHGNRYLQRVLAGPPWSA